MHIYIQISSYSEEKEGGSYCGRVSRRCGESREAQSQGLVNMQSCRTTEMFSPKSAVFWRRFLQSCTAYGALFPIVKTFATTGTNFYMFIADYILGILLWSLRFVHVYSHFDVDCPISPGAHDFKAQQHGQVGKAAASPRTQGPCSEWGGRWGGEMGRGDWEGKEWGGGSKKEREKWGEGRVGERVGKVFSPDIVNQDMQNSVNCLWLSLVIAYLGLDWVVVSLELCS